jgi:hypothetical protein
MVSGLLPNQANHLQASLVDDNVNVIPLRETTYSFINVCMKTLNLANRERNKTKTL